MQLLSDIGIYLWAVVSSAWGLFALSLETLELLPKLFSQTDRAKAVKAWLGKRVWAIRGLAIACLIIASFLAWRGLYEKLEPQRAEQARQQWAADAVGHCSDLKFSFTEHRHLVFLEVVKKLVALHHMDTHIDLNKILNYQHPRAYIGYEMRHKLEHAEFTLQCLEKNGYVKLLNVAPAYPPWPHINSFQNVAIEFVDKWQQIPP